MQAIRFRYDRFYFRATCLIFVLVTCPTLWGQAKQKRMLSTADYPLWSQIYPEKISGDGNWASYRLQYEYSGADTLTVQQINGNIKYSFPYGREGKFNGESEFACIASDTLFVQNLQTGIRFKSPAVQSFEFSADEKLLAVFVKQADKKLSMEIRDKKGKVIQQIADITYYRFDPLKKGVVCCTSKDGIYRVEMVLFKDASLKKIIADDNKGSFQNVVWKENAIAFIENFENGPLLFSYDVTLDQLAILDQKNVKGFPLGMKISDARFKNPIHSEDGLRLFFWLKEPQPKDNETGYAGVEIWNSKDKLLYDFKKYMPYYKWSDKLAMWDMKENKVLQVTDTVFPAGFLSADYRHAFIFDPASYEPQSQQSGAYDLYIRDLQTGKKELIIKHYSYWQHPLGSPDGHYLCYSKNGHWWIYDIEKKLHTCMTSGMSNSFFAEDTNQPEEDQPYGIAGWTNNSEIILYDRYDLWKFSLDGKARQRLTSGREVQKTFRVKDFDSVKLNGSTETPLRQLNLKDGFLLLTANKQSGESGLAYWTSKTGLNEMVWENKKITQVMKAGNKKIYLYQDQNFVSAPRLMQWNGKKNEIMQTNKQQEQFHWSKNKRIEYIVNGTKTKGILFFPVGYKPGYKYPMVVYIYERLFSSLNDYVNPSLLSGDGFNVINFTNQGYFVLYPDINYEFGNLRESVTKSVLAAVDVAMAQADIDPNKIGLMGHSFGGYETDLIITQTNRFAAAVAGAAWTDMVSAYLYVGTTFYRPDFFRTENHQLRIGKSLFEDMPSYLNNSPVLLAAAVKTPLLGWTGKEDTHVNATQTMEFYLALRRADKEHTLLVYPGEEHTIDKKENAVDLNVRVTQWFDYYLKNGKRQDWMSSDLNR